MCLAIPAQVVELREGDNAVVDLAGVRKEISLSLVDNIAVGDYVIVHVGFALSKVEEEEAQKIFAYLKQMDELADLNEDGRGERPREPDGGSSVASPHQSSP